MAKQIKIQWDSGMGVGLRGVSVGAETIQSLAHTDRISEVEGQHSP